MAAGPLPHAIAAPHRSPSPGPGNATAPASPAPAPEDGALALLEGATLATPKVLDLDFGTTTLALRQLIEDHPGGQKGQDASSAAPPTTSASTPAQQPTTASPAPTASAVPPSPADTAAPPSSSTTPAASPRAPAVPVPEPHQLLGFGALLAALLTALLALRRIQRARRASTTPATPHPAGPRPVPTAQGEGIARLDTALRTLAHHHGHTSVLRAARITARSLHVLPHSRHQPLPPFTAGPRRWWTLPDRAVLLDEQTASTIRPPCPGLITLGTTRDGALLLLDLTQLPALLLKGSPDDITAVCASLTVEAALSPWADETEIWAIAFGDDLPGLLPTRPITHLPHASQTLRELNARLLEIHQQPADACPPALLLFAPTLSADAAQQLADVIGKARRARITLIAPARTATAYFPEAEVLDASQTGPQPVGGTDTDVTLQRVTPSDYQHLKEALTGTAPPDPPSARHHATTPQQPPEPVQLRGPQEADLPQRPAASAPHTTPAAQQPEPHTEDGTIYPALLTATSRHPQTPPPHDPRPQAAMRPPPAHVRTATAPTPDQPHTSPAPSAEARRQEHHHTGPHREPPDTRAPQLRVLGPVEMDRVPSTGHGPRQAQLAALLYFRPGRSAEALCADMDADRPWTKRTLNARLQGLRRALGQDPAGHPYVPRRNHADDPYQLSPSVRCDWDQFRLLTDRGLNLGPAGLDELEQALALVRGRPFGDKPLPWAEPHQQEMTTRIVTVAHTIAALRTPPGPHHNLTAARRAIATGLDTDNTAELLYRDWMRIEAQAANRQGIHTALTRLQHINTQLDCPIEPETENLINQLLHHLHPDPNP
ncbi:bacterial transcriptional activator domain-containing protein [Streptomyces sp. NPDC003635]